MIMSKLLSAAETRQLSTELEVACLGWDLRETTANDSVKQPNDCCTYRPRSDEGS